MRKSVKRTSELFRAVSKKYELYIYSELKKRGLKKRYCEIFSVMGSFFNHSANLYETILGTKYRFGYTPSFQGIKQKELEKKVNVSKSALSRTLKNMQDDGIIIRTRDNKDERRTVITLTESGAKAAQYSFYILYEIRNNFFCSLDTEEQRILNSLLEKLADIDSEDIDEQSDEK